MEKENVNEKKEEVIEKTLPPEVCETLNPLEQKRLRVLTEFIRAEMESEKKNMKKKKNDKKIPSEGEDSGELEEGEDVEEVESGEEEEEGEEREEGEEEEGEEEEVVVIRKPIKKRTIVKEEKIPLKRRPIQRAVGNAVKKVGKKMMTRGAKEVANVAQKLFTFV
jgi:hypothetical protein